MQGNITLRVEASSPQKLTALREKCAAHLAQEQDVTLVAASSAIDQQQFTVIGTIRGQPDKTWEETVYAEGMEEAKAKALAVDKQRVVVKVLPA